MSQLLLLDLDGPALLPVTAPYVSGSETSQAAAAIVQPSLGARRREVLEWIAAHGPATDNEIIAAMVARDKSANGPRARRVELVKAGFVEFSGQIKSGSQCWRLSASGAVYLASAEAAEIRRREER